MKALMRRGEVMEFLGISKHRLRAMIASGWLRPRRWAARGKALYLSTEVVAARDRMARGEIEQNLTTDAHG